jgi:DNA-binding SARP family transcriptional activator
MKLGKTKGFVNFPGWRHSVMTRLCMKALEAGIEVEYVQGLIRKRGLTPEVPPLWIENWPWPIKIYTLGRFSLLKNGKPLLARGKRPQKPLALLKALIAFGGRDVSEARLTDALWPDTSGDRAHKVFSVTLTRLRELLGDENSIWFSDGLVTLNSRCCWVDVWAFERFISEAGHDNPSPRLTSDRLKFLEKAVVLYNGPFLGRENEEQWWIISLQERLHRKYVQSILSLGSYYEQTGEWQKAIDLYNKGLDRDDLVEEFYKRILVCCQHLGRTGEAHAVFSRCKKRYSASGLNLSRETESIYRAIHSEETKKGQ